MAMNVSDDLVAFNRTLTREVRTVNGVKTAIYLSPNFNDKINRRRPIILFIHGINGSHFGFIPLAKKLYRQDKPRLLLVDLPGHGDSSIPVWHDISNLQIWFTKLLDNLTDHSQAPNLIIAHSFGCYAVTPTNIPLIYITPVPKVNRIYQILAKTILTTLAQFKSFTAFYNWTPFSALRGWILLAHRTPANLKIQWQIARDDSSTSAAQRKFQLQLSAITNDERTFANYKPNAIIVGKYDGIAGRRSLKRTKQLFREADIHVFNSGHLPTTDATDELSDIIRKYERQKIAR